MAAAKTYQATSISGDGWENLDWEAGPWQDMAHVDLGNYMGDRPVHFPDTRVKVGHDDEALYLHYRVEDRYVRAVAEADQGRIWEDSCVEFFFTPGPELSDLYFNLEMNCSGKILLHFHPGGGGETVILSAEECGAVERVHSLPDGVEPEISEAVTWQLACRLPLDLIAAHAPITRPEPGAAWRVNFYKCADQSSHPHWLTWSPVDFHRPNFHLPQYFGTLTF